MAIALVVVPWMPHFFTSAPVRGALQVEAIEPYSTQILRLTRSIHFQVGTFSTTNSSPRTSTVVSGQGFEIADRDRGHLRLGIGAAHHVGIDHRPLQVRRRHQRLDRIPAADLERHDPAELVAGVLSISSTARAMVRLSVSRSCPTSGAPMLETAATQSSSSKLGRRHELHAMALLVEGAHVQQAEIGAAAAAGAQHPGADGQRIRCRPV